MFAPLCDGQIWAEFADSKAKGSRQRWCSETGNTWDEWRKMCPGLRIVRITVTEGWPGE